MSAYHARAWCFFTTWQPPTSAADQEISTRKVTGADRRDEFEHRRGALYPMSRLARRWPARSAFLDEAGWPRSLMGGIGGRRQVNDHRGPEMERARGIALGMVTDVTRNDADLDKAQDIVRRYNSQVHGLALVAAGHRAARSPRPTC